MSHQWLALLSYIKEVLTIPFSKPFTDHYTQKQKLSSQLCLWCELIAQTSTFVFLPALLFCQEAAPQVSEAPTEAPTKAVLEGSCFFFSFSFPGDLYCLHNTE